MFLEVYLLFLYVFHITLLFAMLPVVELHLFSLPLLKAAGDVSRSAQYVFHVQEELLLYEKETTENINTKLSETNLEI